MYICATRPVSNCVGVVLPSGALGAMRSTTITVIYGNHKFPRGNITIKLKCVLANRKLCTPLILSL